MQSKFIKQTVAALAAALVAALAGCGGGGSSGSSDAAGAAPTETATALSPQAALGAKIFVDKTLSASRAQSCQSCHDPAFGHGAPNHDAGQPGGTVLTAGQGGRSSPSIRYLKFNTAFYFAKDGTPTGGFFWDGRAASLADQAGGPFLNPAEMANPDKASVVTKLATTDYAAQFRQVFGSDIFNRPNDAYEAIKTALQAFEQEDAAFAPFTSKYDEVLRGKTTLSAAEQRGLVLFNSPAKGNCAACHPSAKSADGSHPLFTDFSYDALGVPRNPKLKPVQDDAGFYDLGLCALDAYKDRADLCGAFKVPSLRNVALRGSFFHNGRFTDLREALSFYVTRDTNPSRWYTQADGSVLKFDDLPAQYRRNVNRTEAPYNRQEGAAPALTEAEITDLIAFLNTLTDGYVAR
ncbi:cytochrome-c peroxidase [Azohydromonas lata]|uniref:cytochrome-c peroxidase n=1 Tax=Azohydromonas lata TaxID=45677 RepID=UPI00082EC914|nr:cytochrome c peroxidase [Azohydromonas lata]